MPRCTLVALTALALLVGGGPALAEEAPAKLTAKEILVRMDKVNNAFADQTMEIALTVKDVDGSKKTYEFTMLQKGDSKRLFNFTSGEMKGMATLVEDRNSVYVYLPGFKKVRRVTANTMSQGFAGSDMSNDDMAISSWAKGWTPTLEKEDADFYWLSLTPGKDERTEYTRVVHKVAKATFNQMETHYYKGAELVKKLVASKTTDFGGGILHNMYVEVTDPRTGHMTILDTKAFKFNQGLKDDLFTVRQLQWGK